MKITVECGLKALHSMIIEALENNQSIHYTYLGSDPKSLQASMLFEVDDTIDKDVALKTAKNAIKGTPKGKMAVFRVILTDNRTYFPR